MYKVNKMKPISLGNAENGREIILSDFSFGKKYSHIQGSKKKYSVEVYVPVGKAGIETKYYQLHFKVTARSKNIALATISGVANKISQMDKNEVEQNYMDECNLLRDWKNLFLKKTKKITPIINRVFENLPIIGKYLVKDKPLSHKVEVDIGNKQVIVDRDEIRLDYSNVNKASSSIDLKEESLREYVEGQRVEILEKIEKLHTALQQKISNLTDEKEKSEANRFISELKNIEYDFNKPEKIFKKVDEFEDLEKEYLKDKDNKKKRDKLSKIEKGIKKEILRKENKIKEIDKHFSNKKK